MWTILYRSLNRTKKLPKKYPNWAISPSSLVEECWISWSYFYSLFFCPEGLVLPFVCFLDAEVLSSQGWWLDDGIYWRNGSQREGQNFVEVCTAGYGSLSRFWGIQSFEPQNSWSLIHLYASGAMLAFTGYDLFE